MTKRERRQAPYPARKLNEVKDRWGCWRCGFQASVRSQLHVDHIDGDRGNADPRNFQVLCANCHALKTDWERRGYPIGGRHPWGSQSRVEPWFAERAPAT